MSVVLALLLAGHSLGDFLWEFAEAYLVGTLTSFLVAGASGLLLRSLLG